MVKVEIRKDIKSKDYFPNPKHIILYAFSIGDRHYFRYDDPLNTPYDRALKCLVYWREVGMNCDSEFLEIHTQAVENILSTLPLSLTHILQIKELNDLLKQKMKLPKEPELMYKLASVVFFDQHENSTVYEFNYGIKKIKFWKEKTTIKDFFLQKPLLELIPYLQNAGENLEQFSQMTEKVKNQHLDKLLPHLSDTQRMILQDKFK